jgi:predicted RND superfamily exporter protein
MTIRDRFLQPSLRRPRLMAGLWLALLLAFATALTMRLAGPLPVIDNSVGVWFLKDDPNLAVYERNNAAFGSKEWSLLLLETDSVADPAFLRELAQLTAELEAVPHVRRVLSLANVRGLVRPPGRAPTLVRLLDPTSDHAAAGLRDGLALMPSTAHLLLPQGWGTRTALLVQSDNFLHDLDPYRLAIVDSIHRLVAACPSVRSHSLAGTTVINAELNRSARHDALRFYVLVTAMVLLFGLFALRDVRDLAIMSVVLAVAVLGPMGGIALGGIPFNMVTILLPLILVSLSVCDVIHVINAFHGERRHLPAGDAARAAIARLWTPCLWTSIVTVAGMLSLALSSVAPIRQMGLATSAGLVLAWACTMTLVPALLALFWQNHARAADAGWAPGKYGARLLPFLTGRWRWFWLAVAGSLALPVVGLNHLRIDTDYTRFFAPGAPVSQAYRNLRETQLAQSVVEIVVTAPAGSTLDSSRCRTGLWELETRVGRLPLVRHTLSEETMLQQVDQVLNGPSADARWLTYPAAAVQQLRAAARNAGLTELDDYSTPDGSRRRLLVLTDYLSSQQLHALQEAVAQLAGRFLPPDVSAAVQGTPVLWANMDGEIGRTQLTSILVLAAVFVILLPILFRSFRLGLLGILINGLPLAMTFGLMGLLDIRLNMATALIGGVSIGSTVDSTLFFINRFQTELAAGRSWHEAIEASVRGVGDGILITTGILAGGFLCMTVSSFMPTAHFGIFTCFTILTGAFLDIIIDPILLGLLAPRGAQEQPAALAPSTVAGHGGAA